MNCLRYLPQKIPEREKDIKIAASDEKHEGKTAINSYTESDFLSEVFITEEDFKKLRNLILHKKNVILQGPPGVGKTFVAKRLAYAIIGEKSKDRISFIQFHQSYSYEDFIQGYRPSKEGGFIVKNGPFYEFCKKAEGDPKNKYFFIIDEINRGNLSKIFGELLMLIEPDKRGEEIKMLYSDKADELFSVPKNLYIIGTMNTADRSLAMMDYALRRRFSFFDLKPEFDSEGFKLIIKEIGNKKFEEFVKKIKEVNTDIENDPSLGEGYLIGHSYLCKENLFSEDRKDDMTDDKLDERLKEVLEYDIIPLLKEYWFEDKNKWKEHSEALRAVLR